MPLPVGLGCPGQGQRQAAAVAQPEPQGRDFFVFAFGPKKMTPQDLVSGLSLGKWELYYESPK